MSENSRAVVCLVGSWKLDYYAVLRLVSVRTRFIIAMLLPVAPATVCRQSTISIIVYIVYAFISSMHLTEYERDT